MPAPPAPDRLAEAKPFLFRVRCFFGLWSLKLVVKAFILLNRHVLRRSASGKPSYTKKYASQVGHAAHVFIPSTYVAGSSPRLPLFIDIHGGGFAIGDPLIDDADNAILSHRHGFVVVSIDYRLGPLHPFPTPVHDVAALMQDVLADDQLPVDSAKVVVGGYSAGANLALAALQLHGLHARVRGVVAMYPPTDFAKDPVQRRAVMAKHPDGRKDSLATTSSWFVWGYVSPGTRLADPLLSPLYADKARLPASVYLLGCEYDMLCHEAEMLADRLAEDEVAEKGVEKKVADEKGAEAWECGRIRWRKVMGVEHGFNQIVRQKVGEEKELYTKRSEEMYADVADWANRVAFS